MLMQPILFTEWVSVEVTEDFVQFSVQDKLSSDRKSVLLHMTLLFDCRWYMICYVGLETLLGVWPRRPWRPWRKQRRRQHCYLIVDDTWFVTLDWRQHSFTTQFWASSWIYHLAKNMASDSESSTYSDLTSVKSDAMGEPIVGVEQFYQARRMIRVL